jgi:hypothetical protein
MVEYDDGTKKLESISLELPEDINTVVYEDSSGDPVASTVQLSKWGVPDGKSNVDSNRSSLILRDLRLSVSPNSYYGLEIVRGTVTRSYNNYVTSPAVALMGDNKFPVVGSADNLTITINSHINKGFKLNSLSWRGQLHLKGSRGI